MEIFISLWLANPLLSTCTIYYMCIYIHCMSISKPLRLLCRRLLCCDVLVSSFVSSFFLVLFLSFVHCIVLYKGLFMYIIVHWTTCTSLLHAYYMYNRQCIYMYGKFFILVPVVASGSRMDKMIHSPFVCLSFPLFFLFSHSRKP